MNSLDTIPYLEKKDVRALSVYRYAVELFTLSRKLNENLLYTKPKHWSDKTAQQALALTQSLSLELVSLPFTIAEAEVTIDFSKKVTFQQRITHKIENIYAALHTLDQLYKKDNHIIKMLDYKTQILESTIKKWFLGLTSNN